MSKRVAMELQFDPEVFRALGEPNRLALLGRLAMARRPLTVSEAGSCCGVHISGVSRHLAQLREAGLVSASRDGREVKYHLRFESLIGTLRGLADALECCQARCCPSSKEGGCHDES